MTAREKAIEAAARAIYGANTDCWSVPGSQMRYVTDPSFDGVATKTREHYKRCAKAAAPHIESALLDRIERKVRLQGLVDPDSTDAWSNGWEAALDAVLAILTEIRQETGE